ncbi:hypothetical protein [Erythrobacter sp. F6033]|uniref:hypothetical protein n=1 Tax=Erythrobacter sp. F6033 TaxID=2926401 RepID=UPI001FF396C2|nr:hypothetical protein [Erythrobacter sp. F6033]MCK0128504.1 hypothetical protein [Erythrobacter sp. F6033]
MTIKRASLAAIGLMMVAACGEKPDNAATTNAAAEDFAARINGPDGAAKANTSGTAATPSTAVSPTVAQPLPNAAAGAFVAGTATDPNAVTCDANKMGPFIGRVADAPTRTDIEIVASAGREIRFIRPGAETIAPDATNPRLNLMLDSQDIIRDARCG